MNDKRSINITITIALFVVLTGSVGYMMYRKGLALPGYEPKSLTTTNKENVGWKTYSNAVYGYEISYPGNFDLYSGSGSDPIMVVINKVNNSQQANSVTFEDFRIQSDNTISSVSVDKEGISYTRPRSVRELLQQSKENKEEDVKVREISANGLVGFQVTSVGGTNYDSDTKVLSTEVYLSHGYDDTKFFSLDAAIGTFKSEEEKQKLSPSLDIFNSIVSTFKIIPKISGSIEGKIYTGATCSSPTAKNYCVTMPTGFSLSSVVNVYDKQRKYLWQHDIDRDGNFTFQLSPGSYTFELMGINSQNEAIEVSISPNPIKVIDGVTTNISISVNAHFSD